MLVIGNYESFMGLNDKVKMSFSVYNFSSRKEHFGKRLQLLPVTQLSVYDKEFDQFYLNFIINNDLYFMTFMELVYNLYRGVNVYIGISNGDIYESLAESLTKIFQCRYGYIAQFLHETNDFDENDDSEFSSMGIQVFDQDRERYIQLLNRYGIDTGGII